MEGPADHERLALQASRTIGRDDNLNSPLILRITGGSSAACGKALRRPLLAVLAPSPSAVTGTAGLG